MYSCTSSFSRVELMHLSMIESIKIENDVKIDEIFDKLDYHIEEKHNKYLIKLIISDIRSILPKKGYKKMKSAIKYAEEFEELTYQQLVIFKNSLIRMKKELIRKFRAKKEYEYKNKINDFYVEKT